MVPIKLLPLVLLLVDFLSGMYLYWILLVLFNVGPHLSRSDNEIASGRVVIGGCRA